ncbi:tetratricopeptide repeat protein, partial [Candidatus Bipolaricaulota bacterium]|nr:tetratricopeptide repeat protein [Candidatus Bipolaricaulota bacterium]
FGSEDAFVEAEEAARKALELARDLPEAHTSLALVAWLKDRDRARAEEQFKTAIGLNPSNAEAHHWYGQLLEQLERPREAFVEVLKAHEVDPLSPRFNFTLGFMLIMERRFADAAHHFEQALEIDPGFVEAQIWLGRTRQVAWDWKGSEEAYRKAVDAAPESPATHQWLSQILISVGREDETLAEMKRAMELAKQPYPRWLNYNQGIGYYFLREYDLALHYMKEVAEGFCQACWGLAWIYNELGEYEKALSSLDEAEETLGGSYFYPRSFHSVWIVCNRGVAYARMGELEKAREQVAWLEKSTDKLCRELCIAILHFVLGDADLGFEWLVASVEKHNGLLMYIKCFPMLDPVRSDPSYLAILKKMGLPL